MTLDSRQPANTVNFPFREVWSVSNRQKGLITCTAISPSSVWVASASQDSKLMFLDHKAGILVGIFDLESMFYATTAVWLSDTTLVFGCSNGVVYHLDFEHKSKHPISIHAVIKPLRSPIRCIAFDTYRDMLAIACGGEVWIYVRSFNTSPDAWDCVDHILAPCAGAASLVTSLCFFGTALQCRHLFIGHAKAGWTVWLASRSYHRTPYIEGGGVCTIGSATIPPGEKFIAVSTLENSLVTYVLKDGGPVVDTAFQANLPVLINYRPALPIVSNSSLVFKGTAVGNIEVLDPRSRATASLHHSHNHIIRTLNAYGDRIIVGSSDLDDETQSSLRCYTLASAAEPRDWRRIHELQGPIFEIALSSVLSISQPVASFDPFGVFNLLHSMRSGFRWRQGMVSLLLVCLAVMLITLTLEPPSEKPSYSGASDVKFLPQDTPNAGSLPRKPTLSTLVMWGAHYLGKRLSAWFIWINLTGAWVAKQAGFVAIFIIKNVLLALALLLRVVSVIPRLVVGVVLEIPDALVDFICDLLQLHGFEDICPEW